MAKLTLTKSIPHSLEHRYTNLGWQIQSEDGDSYTVSKTVVVPYSSDAVIRLGGNRPYLTFCGQIMRPLGKQSNLPLSRAVRFFPPGNVKLDMNQALSIVESMWSLYSLTPLPLIKTLRGGREYPLLTFGNFDTAQQRDEYQRYLFGAIGGKEYSEEELFLRFEHGHVVQTSDVDFWFDVRNGVFFSFDRMFLQHIEQHLRASFENMRNYLSGG